MFTTVVTTQKLFGMFELDSANSIIYSRLEREVRGDEVPANDLRGYRLFEDASHFSNADELRRRVNYFRAEGGQADSFDFTCHYDDGDVPVRVLLARVGERSGDGSTKSILLHIRRRR